MSSSADLPDLNVWLALATPDHVHHQQAVAYWEEQAAEQVLFCTVTALGLVRLVSQPKVMGSAVKVPRALLHCCKRFASNQVFAWQLQRAMDGMCSTS